MNGDEFHEIQETALLADIKMCYNLIWLCVNVCIHSKTLEIIFRIVEEQCLEWGNHSW